MMTKPLINIIVAIGKNNRAIGKNNALLWHISDDLKRFKALTTGQTVIMGRKTFESIGHALPNRNNIIMIEEIRAELRRARRKDKEEEPSVNKELVILTRSVEKLVKIVTDQAEEIKQLKEQIKNIDSNQKELKHNVYADDDINVFMIDESKQNAQDTMITQSEINRGREKFKKERRRRN